LPTGAARLKGFRDALASAGGACTGIEELGAPGSREFAQDALRRVLTLPEPPTAVVTGSVLHTFGVLEELLDSGVSVPKQLSVAGFSDEPAFRWWGPGLTTVALPVSELATACGLWFVHRMKQKVAGNAPYSAISPPTLVVRGSTQPPGASA
jgi:LacI family transcriptional regulator